MQRIDYIEAALCLKTLAHPHRLEIIQFLVDGERVAVGEIAEFMELESHVVSEHLTLMKDRGLLSSQREGRKVYYAIAEPVLLNIMDCIKKKFAHKKG